MPELTHIIYDLNVDLESFKPPSYASEYCNFAELHCVAKINAIFALTSRLFSFKFKQCMKSASDKSQLVSTTFSRDDEALIKRSQLEFYYNGKTGCAFAALAAKTPERYGWRQVVLPVVASTIKIATEQAIADPKTTMISLIFPSVSDLKGLQTLIFTLENSGVFHLDQEKDHAGFRCIGLRARVGNLQSWVSGFGPFDFFPVTRQSPHLEITFRVKARPDYKQFMKKAPEGIVHLADLDFFGDLSWAAFQTVWKATLKKTKEILGHEPDLRSAAKTTFTIPK